MRAVLLASMLVLLAAGCPRTPWIEPPTMVAPPEFVPPDPEITDREEPPLGQRLEEVLAQVDDAQRAIASGNRELAESKLDGVEESILQLHTLVPGDTLLDYVEGLLSDAAATEQPLPLDDLLARLSPIRDYMDPQVLQSLEAARAAQASGDRALATRHLRAARDRISANTLHWPIDQARSNVVDARIALNQGRMSEARARLLEARGHLETVLEGAPLVPVQWSLRGAASAADRGDWNQVQTQLGDAIARLQEIEDSPELPLPGGLQELRSDAEALRARTLDPAQRPTPDEIRQLSLRMHPVAED